MRENHRIVIVPPQPSISDIESDESSDNDEHILSKFHNDEYDERYQSWIVKKNLANKNSQDSDKSDIEHISTVISAANKCKKRKIVKKVKRISVKKKNKYGAKNTKKKKEPALPQKKRIHHKSILKNRLLLMIT